MSNKTIAMFLDGTWNTPESNTNVYRAKMLVASSNGSSEQRVYYDPGLGTQSFESFRGGVFGKGLRENIIEAYNWLSKNYEDGDDVFVFGFSRGAFTATSITGMLMRWGLIRPESGLNPKDIFKLYETWDERTPIYELEFLAKTNPTELTQDQQDYLKKSRRIQIKMIGIWDSVATIGIPFGNFSRFSRNALKFHNPRWSSTYDSFYHALAIDEHRKPFRSVLLHHYIKNETPKEKTEWRRGQLVERVEQRWFCGSHGDVGGGDNLNVVSAPFAWIMQKAETRGLKLTETPMVSDHEHVLNDSYKAFIKGLYRIVRFGKRYRRKIGSAGNQVTGGWIEPIRETIVESVFRRWQAVPKYRPQNLIKALEQRSCAPEQQTEDLIL